VDLGSHLYNLFTFFFFSSRRRHTRFSRDWSSDVCSSDLSTPAHRLVVMRDGQVWMAGPMEVPQEVEVGYGGGEDGGQAPPGEIRSEERRVGKERRPEAGRKARWKQERPEGEMEMRGSRRT